MIYYVTLFDHPEVNLFTCKKITSVIKKQNVNGSTCSGNTNED